MERKSNSELQEHMLWSYYGLRVGLVVIAFSLPIVLYLAGNLLHEMPLQSSLSAYYYTPVPVKFLTTRDLFVGGLFGAAACLYLYKGFSNKENIALNLAGIFVVLVALLPTADRPENDGLVSKIHGVCAVLFFGGIIYVSLFRSRDTLHLLPPKRREVYERRYLWTSLALIVLPLTAVILSYWLRPNWQASSVTFWAESLAVGSFGAYWLVKTLEMRESAAEKRVLDAELERTVVPLETLEAAEEQATGVPPRTREKTTGRGRQVEKVLPAPAGRR